MPHSRGLRDCAFRHACARIRLSRACVPETTLLRSRDTEQAATCGLGRGQTVVLHHNSRKNLHWAELQDLPTTPGYILGSRKSPCPALFCKSAIKVKQRSQPSTWPQIKPVDFPVYFCLWPSAERNAAGSCFDFVKYRKGSVALHCHSCASQLTSVVSAPRPSGEAGAGLSHSTVKMETAT